MATSGASSACLEFIAAALSGSSHRQVSKSQLVHAAGNDSGVEALRALLVDLVLVAGSGLSADTSSLLASFWANQEYDTGSTEMPPEGDVSRDWRCSDCALDCMLVICAGAPVCCGTSIPEESTRLLGALEPSCTGLVAGSLHSGCQGLFVERTSPP